MFKKIIKYVLLFLLVAILLGVAGGTITGFYYYLRFTRDLPKIERVSDYQPKAVTSLYSEHGELIAELWEKRRYPVSFSEIPVIVRQAFLAAEDANFYRHPGIDFISILRAVYINWREGRIKQGASTITQQVVKALLLTHERKYERKIKEAILAYRLEQALTKDEIFSIYLNEIFLGSQTYGVKAAARVHFHKELKELNIAEAAYLGGLPQKPSFLSNPKHYQEALERQRYVLSQMLRNAYITSREKKLAEDYKLTVYPPDNRKIQKAPYFTGHVIKLLEKELGAKVTHPGGFRVYTTVNLPAYKMAESAVRKGLREVDKRRGWRGPLAYLRKKSDVTKEVLEQQSLADSKTIEHGQIYRGLVTKVFRSTEMLNVLVQGHKGSLDLKKAAWAKKLIEKGLAPRFIVLSRYIKPGHIIEVSLVDEAEKKQKYSKESDKNQLTFRLDQTPILEGAFAVSNALTGEVKAIIGGYDYKRSQFNRATQGLRQPGSAFKPFIYVTALDVLNFTPSTLVPDSPISLVAGDGSIWSPSNYDHKYLGPITLRTALQRSRNVVSAYLISKIGPERVVQTAKRFGITSPILADFSISLGAAEVKLIELVHAYGAFAAGGWLAEPLFITTIRDRNGKVVYEKRPKQEQILSEDSAFIMANLMKGVVERGTAQRVKKLGRPIAGKTGTTNDQMDAWFIGYTPEWVAGAWVGFDEKRTIGRFETGGKAAAPIFVYFMKEFLADEPILDFEIPDGVIPVTVNIHTGRLANPGDPGAFVEYFKTGSEPNYSDIDIEIPRDYLSSDEF